MVDRATHHPKIAFIWNTVIEEVLGTDRVSGLRLKNNVSGEVSDFACDGLFVALGHQPATEVFKDKIELDAHGFVVLKEQSTKTSAEGVFAAGDCSDPRYRQAITAAGSGAKAAIDAESYLSTL